MTKLKKCLIVLITAISLIFVTSLSFGGVVFADETGAETGTETNTSQSAENGSNSGGNAEGKELIEEEENGEETPAESGTDGAETNLTGNTETGGETETDSETGTDIAASFIEYLKTVYGANYETYYNAIIDGWGSVEEYLLSIEMPTEEAQTSWEAFVGWLNDYAVVWVPIVAVIAVIVVAVLKKKKSDKYEEEYKTLTEASNQQSEALLAVIAAQKALLANNENFSEATAALEKAEEELKTDV